jgi:V-type H+-transporting ATPase subunit e
MGFLVTSAIFLLSGIVGCLFSLLCCNRGPSTNLYVLPPSTPSVIQFALSN